MFFFSSSKDDPWSGAQETGWKNKSLARVNNADKSTGNRLQNLIQKCAQKTNINFAGRTATRSLSKISSQRKKQGKTQVK